ncbi:MAG TPA: hypothetical protein VJ816_04070, partial [Gemmatimonadales bacterium]|nr:hypothetical protein [Gemmatimonadales bacterium]
ASEPKPTPSGTPQTFTLMGLAAGTRYCLAAKAVDDNLNTSPLPTNAPCATTDPVSVRFAADAETGSGGFTADAAWHRDTYRNRTPGGGFSWKVGGSGSAYYANNLNSSLVSPYVTLGPGSVLQFWHRMLAKETNDADSPDGGIVEIQPLGSGTWTQITPAGGYNYAHVGGPFPAGTRLFAGNIPWKEELFDLSTWSGDVRFRFRFGSNASSTWEGWYIDDIAVVAQVVPVEVPNGEDGESPLRIDKSGSDLSFSWGAVAGADVYNLYRGSLGSLTGGAYDHACLQGNVTGRATTRPDTAGDFYFLVTAQNHAGEGPAGRDSEGGVIPIGESQRCSPTP